MQSQQWAVRLGLVTFKVLKVAFRRLRGPENGGRWGAEVLAGGAEVTTVWNVTGAGCLLNRGSIRTSPTEVPWPGSICKQTVKSTPGSVPVTYNLSPQVMPFNRFCNCPGSLLFGVKLRIMGLQLDEQGPPSPPLGFLPHPKEYDPGAFVT